MLKALALLLMAIPAGYAGKLAYLNRQDGRAMNARELLMEPSFWTPDEVFVTAAVAFVALLFIVAAALRGLVVLARWCVVRTCCCVAGCICGRHRKSKKAKRRDDTASRSAAKSRRGDDSDEDAVPLRTAQERRIAALEAELQRLRQSPV